MNKKRIVLFALLALAAGGLLTVPWWLTPVLGYLTAHKDEIQTLAAAAGILGFLGGIAAAVWAYLRRPEAPPASRAGVTITTDANKVIIVTPDGSRIAAADAEPELLFDAYLGSLADECSRLPLGVIDTEFARDRGEHAVRLSEVYVELDVTSHRRPSEEEERDWAWRLVRGEAAGRQPVLAALAGDEARRHVLLGDPGSGKTTLANHLCHALAAGDAALPETLRGLVPVRFVLRELAARHVPADAATGKADMLWNALEENLAGCVGEAAAKELFPFVRRRLLASGGFVVFDGLDEVPESGRRRQVLLEAVEAFAATLARSPSRLLVTARPYAYADPRWQLAEFPILALAPFSEEQVGRFITGWYERAARRVFAWSAETAAARSRRLRAALKERPYLGDLASRPLLLTLMATLHSSWGQLPEDRADLYEETVKLLLSRWQRAREVRGRRGEPVVEESISQVLAVDESRLREALETLAFTVHQRQGSEPERGSEPADVSEGELLVAFKRLQRDLSAEVLLDYLRDRAGLLIERREEVYAFPHRSFQEYLAACHLASLPDPTERFREKAFADPLWWREVVLLGIGRSKRAGMGNAVAIVAALLPSDPAAEAPIAEVDWRVAVVCGQALLELRLAEVGGDQPRYRALLERTRKWLAELVAGGRLSPQERLEAGDVLGHLGDPRPGVGILSAEATGGPELPDVGWVEVPAGEFTMGSAEDDPLAMDREKPAHPVRLNRFWISRYPITNAQFGLFCDGDGYTNREYWTDAGWNWVHGADPDPSVYPEEIRKWYRMQLAARPKEKRQRPFYWDDARLSAPTRPVVGVTWYEASAYCRWLEARIRELENVSVLGVDVEHPAGCRVRLPSEAEWEKAARGTGASRWPWGKDFTEGCCNSDETGLKETSPAGMFPDNRSPYGACDMAGNVWEWTSTIWGKTTALDYKYPYVADDGREEINVYVLRVVRGGSFYNDKRFARCAARDGSVPGVFVRAAGFRVVFSLANSEF